MTKEFNYNTAKTIKRDYYQHVNPKAENYSASWSMVLVMDDTKNHVIRIEKISNWNSSYNETTDLIY